jgi:hypothetical protein
MITEAGRVRFRPAKRVRFAQQSVEGRPRIDTPVELEYYRNGGTAKRAHGAEEVSQGSVKLNLPEAHNLREVFWLNLLTEKIFSI